MVTTHATHTEMLSYAFHHFEDKGNKHNLLVCANNANAMLISYLTTTLLVCEGSS